MVNVNKLRGKIVERGMSVESVAQKMGIHKSTFYRKMAGHCPVTIQDADMLVRILDLDCEEAKAIFFSQFVAQMQHYR